MQPFVGKTVFLPELVSRVLNLCDMLSAKIVLISAWRNQGWGFDPFNEIFAGNVIGQTPEILTQIGQTGVRENEIKDYLKEIDHPVDYIIIDDNEANFNVPNAHLYLTNSNVGITDNLVQMILCK